MRLAVAAVLAGCVGGTKPDSGHSGTDSSHTAHTGAAHTGAATPTGDTGCDIADVSCAPGDTGGYGECPTGYACSGIPAYWCYRGPSCSPPECLPPEAAIDTPLGPRAVAELRAGDLVWTVSDGRPVVAPLRVVRSRDVPADHQVVEVELADGRTVTASPGHPTADGVPLGDLRPGDELDGALILRAERVSYGRPRTWDLLPAGPTGDYRADGVLLGSTLR